MGNVLSTTEQDNGNRVMISSNKDEIYKEFGYTDIINKRWYCMATLPEGWSVIETPTKNSSDDIRKRHQDENGIPRISIVGRDCMPEPYCYGNVHTKEEGIKILQKQLKEKTKAEKEKEEKINTIEFILKERSEEWKEDIPFGVFFIKDVSDLLKERIQIGHKISPKIKSCHGFWKTEELAEKAMNLLHKTYGDYKFIEKKNEQTITDLKKEGYKMHNGIADSVWYAREQAIQYIV